MAQFNLGASQADPVLPKATVVLLGMDFLSRPLLNKLGSFNRRKLLQAEPDLLKFAARSFKIYRLFVRKFEEGQSASDDLDECFVHSG